MCCEELIRALVKRADTICGKLIARMFRDHQEVNARYLCDIDYVFIFGGWYEIESMVLLLKKWIRAVL